jgi:hypothetical protein
MLSYSFARQANQDSSHFFPKNPVVSQSKYTFIIYLSIRPWRDD